MKRLLSIVFCIVMIFVMAVPVFAAEPVITQHPQSGTWKEGAVAYFSVEVTGQYLKYNWFLEYNGATYFLNDADGSEPWASYVTSGFGRSPAGDGFFFEGIGKELNGSAIWVEVNDGHFTVESQKAYISVTGANAPSVTAQENYTVEQGDVLDITVNATDPTGKGMEYLWYSSSVARLENMIAIDRGAHTKKAYRVDTSFVGVTYYVCDVSNSAGSVYSPIIRVEVVEKTRSIPVLFTSSSDFRVGGYAKVDIEAMTDYDARIWNAFLEKNVSYVWYDHGTCIAELINKDTMNFYDGMDGKEIQVMVKCDDLELYSEKYIIAADEERPAFDITTSSLPDAYVGEQYSFKIKSNDSKAEFWEYYNPGKKNELSQTGLTISQDGTLSGIPTQAGTYGFTIAGMGKNGEEDVAVLTLTVKPAEEKPDPTGAGSIEPTGTVTEPTEAPETEKGDKPNKDQLPLDKDGENTTGQVTDGGTNPDNSGKNDSDNLWLYIGIGLGVVIIGIAIAVVVLLKPKRKNKN